MTTLLERSTLVHQLRDRAQIDPNGVALIYLADGEHETASVTYATLDRHARSIAVHLLTRAIEGERVLLLIPPGPEFVAAFLGCLYAGLVAIPAYPPLRRRRDSRIDGMAGDASARLALVTSEALADMDGSMDDSSPLRSLHCLAVDTLLDGAEAWREPAIAANGPAYLQYTSGSTSRPKGVMVSHDNVAHNCSAIRRICGLDENSVSVSWLPPFHDMGLITGIAVPLFCGFPSVLLPPTAFLRRPIRWLRAISRYGATLSGAPNAAYDMCVERTTVTDREGLDLGRWATAFNGSERVRTQTLERFVRAFAPYGFARRSFAPAYGLAEATLLVSAATGLREPRSMALCATALERGEVQPADEQRTDARRIVGCGPTAPEMQVTIVDPVSKVPCPADRVGEIWVSGPSVAQGYWARSSETEQMFEARLDSTRTVRHLRTGDLGFQRDGEVFVTGRMKDMIIVRGRNLYPDDIELSVACSHPALRMGMGAALAIDTEDSEQVVVVQGIERRALADIDVQAVIGAIRSALSEEYEIDLWSIVLVPSGSIPRTSSGKIARAACRQQYVNQELDILASWQNTTATPRGAQEIGNWLAMELAKRFFLDVTAIDLERPFTEYGLDSLSAVDLTVALEEWLGRRVVDTLFWDYPTPRALAEYLAHNPPSAMSAVPRI